MAENIPNIPSGAVPPKKETGKVQPKKETVRINLPPKPSAAPTIKLPTLPPGGPTGGPGAAPAPSAAAPAHPPSAPRATAAAPAAKGAVAPAPRAQQAPVAYRPAVSTLDTILAVLAAIVGLAAVGSTVYLWQFLPNL